jgi:hypothetical protein
MAGSYVSKYGDNEAIDSEDRGRCCENGGKNLVCLSTYARHTPQRTTAQTKSKKSKIQNPTQTIDAVVVNSQLKPILCNHHLGIE